MSNPNQNLEAGKKFILDLLDEAYFEYTKKYFVSEEEVETFKEIVSEILDKRAKMASEVKDSDEES